MVSEKLWVRMVPSSRVIRSAPMTTLSRLRLLREAEATRQYPAALVEPVLIPSAPLYR